MEFDRPRGFPASHRSGANFSSRVQYSCKRRDAGFERCSKLKARLDRPKKKVRRSTGLSEKLQYNRCSPFVFPPKIFSKQVYSQVVHYYSTIQQSKESSNLVRLQALPCLATFNALAVVPYKTIALYPRLIPHILLRQLVDSRRMVCITE